MRFSSLLSGAIVALASFTEAAPATKGSTPKNTRQAATSNIASVGVKGGNPQVRMELRDMQRNHTDMFNLYLLGLREMMNVDQSNPLSYYQIAGIHGRPYIPYDSYNSQCGSGGCGAGYCTHVMNIFLTWHRPYLALFEQTLYSHVQNVANQFTGSDLARYQSAAANFRIPYWDWAQPEPRSNCPDCITWPKLVSSQYVTVNAPKVGSQSVLNPLFRYDFNPLSASDMVYSPFTQWTVTKRSPTANDASAVSNNSNVAAQMVQSQPQLAKRVYDLFTKYNNFTQFSNEAWYTSTTVNPDSIESVHDQIHIITGSNGHMTYLDYSAFDPIFWLHHVNIDRLWAMWSFMYPGSYVTAQNSRGPTFTTQSNTPIDASWPLVPFAKDNNRNLYTSNDVRSTTPFNYYYPELQTGATNASVKAAINRLYNSGSVSTMKRRDLHKRSDSAEYQYTANVVSQKFQVNGSYAVYTFFGQPSDDPKNWPIESNMVGFHGVTANLANEDSPGMSSMNMPVTGTIPLTNALTKSCDSGALADLTPNSVEPYLQSQLQWRVALLDGTEIPVTDVPDLSITIVVSEVTPPATEEDFPTFSNFVNMANVTSGQPGGHSDKWWGFANAVASWTTGELISAGLTGTPPSGKY